MRNFAINLKTQIIKEKYNCCQLLAKFLFSTNFYSQIFTKIQKHTGSSKHPESTRYVYHETEFTRIGRKMVAIIEKEEKQKGSWVEKNRRKYNGTRLQQWPCRSIYLKLVDVLGRVCALEIQLAKEIPPNKGGKWRIEGNGERRRTNRGRSWAVQFHLGSSKLRPDFSG